MVDAAERLMAERGIEAVPLRDVLVASAQRNKSAAHYHFGSRDGLIRAIIETRMAPVNTARVRAPRGDDRLERLCLDRGACARLVEPLADATVRRSNTCYARFSPVATPTRSGRRPSKRAVPATPSVAGASCSRNTWRRSPGNSAEHGSTEPSPPQSSHSPKWKDARPRHNDARRESPTWSTALSRPWTHPSHRVPGDCSPTRSTTGPSRHP